MSLYGGVELPGHPDLENIRKLDLLAIPMIRRATRLGMAIDPDYFHQLSSTFSEEMRSLEKDIASYIPPERLREFSSRSEAIEEEQGAAAFNPRSAEQIGALLWDMLGIGAGVTQLKKTSAGKTSTGKKNLELVKSQHPVIPLILRYRELSKLKSTYSDSIPQIAVFHPRGNCCPVCELPHTVDTWRVHCEIVTTRADTGRLATRNKNLQNIPTRTDDGQRVQAGFVASGYTHATGKTQGYRMLVRDYSQIELRGLAHLANCKSMIDVYLNDGDIHDDTSRKVFRLLPDEKPDKIKHRMASKRCIAKGQRVLTHRGLVAIEKVMCNDLLWDGIEWVSHDGVVCNGRRMVIEYEGLRATADHRVWTEKGPTSFQEAKRNGLKLAITGFEEGPPSHTDSVRNFIPKLFRIFMFPSEMRSLSKGTGDRPRQYQRQEQWYNLPGLRTPKILRPESLYFAETLRANTPTLYQPAQSSLETLWRTWNQEHFCKHREICEIYAGASTTSKLHKVRHWAHKQRRELCSGESQIGDTREQSEEQKEQSLDQIQRKEYHYSGVVQKTPRRLSKFSIEPEAYLPACFRWCTVGGNTQPNATRPVSEEIEVYDILNAGPRHRFTVEGKLVANCNFGIQNGTTERGLHMQLVMDYGANKMPIPDWLTPEWCRWFIDEWLRSRPEVTDYFSQQWYRARRYGMVWSSFGRVKLIPEVKSCHAWVKESGFRQAQNMPVTGIAADQLRLAMAITDDISLRLLDGGLWNWILMMIHDSLMFEVEEDCVEEVSQALGEGMDSVMVDRDSGEHLFRIPIKSDGEIMEVWRK